jgi:hypothetical protein
MQCSAVQCKSHTLVMYKSSSTALDAVVHSMCASCCVVCYAAALSLVACIMFHYVGTVVMRSLLVAI